MFPEQSYRCVMNFLRANDDSYLEYNQRVGMWELTAYAKNQPGTGRRTLTGETFGRLARAIEEFKSEPQAVAQPKEGAPNKTRRPWLAPQFVDRSTDDVILEELRSLRKEIERALLL